MMDNSSMYHYAELAAAWMERGDDVKEAEAVRQLIAEHKAMVAEKEAKNGANPA